MPQIAIRVPASKRKLSITQYERYETNNLFLKFPEILFLVDIGECESTVWSKLRCFYVENNSIYGCILPNHNQKHQICMDRLDHWRKYFSKGKSDNEIAIECIEAFYYSRFGYYDTYFLINNFAPWNLKTKTLKLTSNFSAREFFQFWVEGSKKEEFSINNNEIVKNRPFTAEYLQEIGCPTLESVPYYKDWLSRKNTSEHCVSCLCDNCVERTDRRRTQQEEVSLNVIMR